MNINKPVSEYNEIVIRGSWTKYGGGRQSLVKSHANKTWYCQACSHEQPMVLPGFLLDVGLEHVKVCTPCFSIARKLKYRYDLLIKQVRTTLT